MTVWAVESRRVDAIILTMSRREFDAVLQVSAGAVQDSVWETGVGPGGLPVAFRPFVTRAGRPLRVAVVLAADRGATAATQVLLPLVEAWRPRCVAMCGVCAGRRGRTQLGDVVAAERLFYRDTGKQLPGDVQQDLTTYKLRDDWKTALEGMNVVERFRDTAWFAARPIPAEWRELRALAALRDGAAEPWSAVDLALDEHGWRDIVASLRAQGLLARTGSQLTEAGRQHIDDALFGHRGKLPDLSPSGAFQPFRLHVAPMATGAEIVDDDAIWAFMSQSMRKTLALETEGAALGELAHRQRQYGIDAVVMKGVMDFADHGRDGHFRDFAARASAECVLAFLREKVSLEIVAGFDDVLTPGTSSVPTHALPPSSLLLARHTVVPWHDGGRFQILADLDDWADDPGRDVAVKLLHAEGGVGKTRLAIEWVQRRRRRYDVAGFLAPEPGATWLERLCSLGPQVLIVIDYAERRADLIEVLERVAAYAQAEGPRRRIRILLLARSEGAWWTVLRGGGSLGALLTDVVPHKLSPLAGTTPDREAVFREAAAVFAAVRGRKDVPPPPIALGDARFDRVLYLHMAALAAVENADFKASSLMDVILDHEERFWVREALNRSALAVHLPLAREVMAAATLRGAFVTRCAAGDACQRLTGRPRTNADDELLALLHHVYERKNEPTYLPGLEPDLLGEAMVLRVAQSPRGAGAPAEDSWIDRVFVLGDDDTSLTTAFMVLGRGSVTARSAFRPLIMRLLCADLHRRAVLALRAAKKIGRQSADSALGDLLAEALEKHGTNAVAVLVECEEIPYPTVSLQRVATWRSQKLLEVVPPGDDIAASSERAEALAQRGRDLDAAGRRAEAVADLQDAVSLYRRLTARNPDEFRRRLAASLNNLGKSLSELGQRQAAFKATHEAVELYRAMVSDGNSVDHEPDLARSLNNFGAILSALGQHDEALAVIRDAVDLYRELAAGNADAFQPSLAASLQNLGNELSGQGQHADANVAMREAVKLYFMLAKRNPDAFTPDLAWSYSSLGIQLSRLGQQNEALKFTSNAVDLYRKLAKRNADVFQAPLAISLNNLGMRLADLGRPEKALEATEEAVELYRSLAERNPNAFGAPLAMSLNNLGNQLSDQGKRHEALAATLEAVNLYRRLAIGNPDGRQRTCTGSGIVRDLAPRKASRSAARQAVGLGRTTITWKVDAFRFELAKSLIHLSERLNNLGQHAEAITATRDAVALYRSLASWSPDAFEPDLARSLNRLGNMLSVHDGWRRAALAATREAEKLFRALVERKPDTFERDLARTLHNLSNRLSSMGERQPALEAARESVDRYRMLVARSSEAFQPDLAHGLNVLGLRLCDVRQYDAAIEETQEAVALYRELVARSPEFEAGLAASLNNLGWLLAQREQREAALVTIREAVALRHAHAKRCPAALAPLAASIANLGNRLGDLGLQEEALETIREAVERYRALSIRSPDRVQLELVRNLFSLGARQAMLDKQREVLATLREALALQKALATRYPGAPGTATSELNQPSSDLAEPGVGAVDLVVGRSATAFYRVLASAARPS